MKWFSFILCCALPMVMLASEPKPVVEISVSPETVMVGESLQLEVTVFVPTWFAGTPVFPSFELTNAITRLPPDSSYPTSRRIDGDTWSGIVRQYEVSPLIAATFELKEEIIKVAWANPGRAPYTAELTVPPIRYRGTVPAGAEALSPFLAGTSFTLERSLSQTDSLKPGDAVVLEIIADLQGLPGFFIPELFNTPGIPGVRLYPGEPLVDDTRRIEKATLVFDEPGAVTIPGVSIEWWNHEQGRIESTSLEPVTLTIEGSATRVAAPATPTPWLWIIIAILGGVITLLAVSAVRRILKPDPETLSYRQVVQAIRARDAERTYQSLLSWSRIATGLDPKDSFQQDAQAVLTALRRHLYQDEAEDFSFSELRRALETARRTARHGFHPDRRSLPPLNP